MISLSEKFNSLFLTGSSGWLGKNILGVLNGNFKELHSSISTINTGDLGKSNIFEENFQKLDLKNKNTIDSFTKKMTANDILIHAAGVIHPSNLEDFYKINFEGSRYLIEAAKDKLKKIIVISSNSPIGISRNYSIFDEASPYNPYMLYGESKLKLEKYLLELIQRNYDITILRPPWFYGPFMPDRQYRFYRMIKDGKVPLVGKGNNLRSKVHLLNLTKAILLAASNEKSKGEIYWVADEKPYSQLEIISIVRDVLKNRFGINVKNRNIKVPYFFGDLCEITDKLLQKIGFYNQSFHVFGELNKTIACDISKIKEHLDYEPIFDFKTGLEQSLIHENSYKNLK